MKEKENSLSTESSLHFSMEFIFELYLNVGREI